MAAVPDTEATYQRIAVDDLEPAPYRKIVRAWCEQRGEARFSPLEKIDPFVVPNLASNLVLLEVAGETLTYRVLGDAVVLAVGTNLKGKTLRQVYGDTDYVRVIEQQLLACAARGVPIYSNHDFQLPDDGVSGFGNHRKAWRIALPYGDEQDVTRLLCYQRFSQEIEISLRKDMDYAKLLPTTVFWIEV